MMNPDAYATMTPDEFARFRPMNGIVVVKRDPRKTMAGSVYLAGADNLDRNRLEPTAGVVVKLGGLEMVEVPMKDSHGEVSRMKRPGTYVQHTVKVGDRVAIGRFAGHDFMIGGENYVALMEYDILAVIGAADLGPKSDAA